MIQKYDTYYEKDIPYTMTLEELHERSEARNGYMTEEDILAYIRHRGADSARFFMRAAVPEDIMVTPFGFALVSSTHERKVLCKMIIREGQSDLYNPLIEEDSLREGHWYHAYKLETTPVEFEGVVDSHYVSDFCSMINEGHIEIWEEVEEEKASA